MEPKGKNIFFASLAFMSFVGNSNKVVEGKALPPNEPMTERSSLDTQEDTIDYTQYDLSKLQEYTLSSIEKMDEGYVVDVLMDTPLYLVPFEKDERGQFDTDDDGSMMQIVANEGMTFEIEEKRLLENIDGSIIELGIIANTFGSEFVGAIVLNSNINNKERLFTEENEEFENAVTYLMFGNEIYPNKVKNVLLGLMNISEYQDKHGPFKLGNEYSLLSMTGLDNYGKFHDYAMGLTSSKAEARAGGVCATATGISTLLSQIGGFAVNRVPHGIHYVQGPFSPNPFSVDAAIFINGENSTDMKWYLRNGTQEGYFHFDVQLIPSRIPYSRTSIDGLSGLTDVYGIATFGYSKDKPIAQTVDLHCNVLQFEMYRDSMHRDKLPYEESLRTRKYSIMNGMIDVAQMIYSGKSDN